MVEAVKNTDFSFFFFFFKVRMVVELLCFRHVSRKGCSCKSNEKKKGEKMKENAI